MNVPCIEIENEFLDARTIARLDLLTFAKLRALERLTRSRRSLLDFGAGSGKYLHFCRPLFQIVEGVEITPSCITFARETLGVVLRPQIPQGIRYDVATAWHALEHLPPDCLKKVAKQLHESTEETFLISVPNSASWASAWFGSLYPYHDAASHFHQFNPQSLRHLLEHSGWMQLVPFRVWIYSIFCYSQGFTNWVTGTHNLLYFRLKRGHEVKTLSRFGLAIHAGLFLTFMPAALFLTALECLSPDKSACLHIACYKHVHR